MAYDVQKLADFREMKNDFYKNHPHSPLTPQQQHLFTELNYYEPKAELALEVEVEVFEEQKQILMQTNRDELKPFFRYGTFSVTVDGASEELTVYKSPDGHYFLPFVDGNAGKETYPAGRYLDLQPEDVKETMFTVDFNLAYNPYCAYNDHYVCPVTPAENRINLPITAGEKLPTGEWLNLG